MSGVVEDPGEMGAEEEQMRATEMIQTEQRSYLAPLPEAYSSLLFMYHNLLS